MRNVRYFPSAPRSGNSISTGSPVRINSRRLSSKTRSSKTGDAELYYRRGLTRHQLRRAQEALQDLNQAITLNPTLADAWYVRGNVFAFLENTPLALKNYERAVEIDSKHAAAWYNRGNLLFNESDDETAIECWTKAVAIQPTLFRAYNNRAAALVRTKKYAEAAKDYQRAIEISPGFARAYDNYAWLLATCEDPGIRETTKAVFLAKRACELTEFKEWSHFSTLAATYAEAGDYVRASEFAQQAIALAPESQHPDLQRIVKLYQSPNRSSSPAPASTATRNAEALRQ